MSILVFDAETTGLRRDYDQIIELAVQVGIGRAAQSHTWRFRPSVPVDPAAERIHGITVAELEGERPFAEHAARLHHMFSQAPVWTGYNVGFDLDMLQAEFQRAGLPPLATEGKAIVDAYRLWQAMEPRGLQHAHRRFVGRDFAGAHCAQADVAATAAVLAGMIAAFDLGEADWPALARLCRPRHGISESGT